MAVYRFKVAFEDNEDVYREIEIKSAQNFEDFHNVIMQSIDFDNAHDASFFISDDYWRKGDEIVLRPVKEDDKRRPAEPKRQMNKCKMASLIDDPHQKFLYIYDPKTQWTFLIELLKIVPDDLKATYPKCAKSIGLAPKQYLKSDAIPVVVDENEFDESEPDSDDEAYVLATNDDETALLESSEGEEEVVEEEMMEDSEELSEDAIEGSYEED